MPQDNRRTEAKVRRFLAELKMTFRAGLKIVASAILADVEPWLPARRNGRRPPTNCRRIRALPERECFSGRQDAALYGRRDACRYFSDRLLGLTMPRFQLSARMVAH